MDRVRYVYWEDRGMWIGYLVEFPDYKTQGETFEDLKKHLEDLYKGLTSGKIPLIPIIRYESSPVSTTHDCSDFV